MKSHISGDEFHGQIFMIFGLKLKKNCSIFGESLVIFLENELTMISSDKVSRTKLTKTMLIRVKRHSLIVQRIRESIKQFLT